MGTVHFSSKALKLAHHPKLPISFRAHIFPHSSRIYHKNGKAFSFTLSACTQLNTPKGKKNKGGKKKIVLIAPPPPPLEEEKLLRSNDGAVGRFPERVFTALRLAMAEMFAVAGFMAVGTIIDQGDDPTFYIERFYEDNDQLTWIFNLGSGHHIAFYSVLFLGTLAFLGASLMAYPLNSSDCDSEAEIVSKTSADLGGTLMGVGYRELLKGPALHALKRLAGRIGPLGIHVALILQLISGGTLVSDTDGCFGESVSVPQGQDLIASGDVHKLKEKLSIAPLDINGVENKSPNVKGSEEDGDVKEMSTLARNPGSIIINQKEGKFVVVRNPNSELQIECDGTKIVIVDAIGSTGLDHMMDLGYAGFGALMFMTCINYLSNAEVRVLQDGKTIAIGGKSKRAKGEFRDRVPETVESASSTDDLSG